MRMDTPVTEGRQQVRLAQSRLYRAITRAHLAVVVVNECLRDGFLESKTTFSTAESRRAWMDDVLELDSLVGFVELSGVHWFARVRALRGDGESVYVKVRGCARARAGNTKQNKAPNSHLRVHTGRFQRGQKDEKFGQ